MSPTSAFGMIGAMDGAVLNKALRRFYGQAAAPALRLAAVCSKQHSSGRQVLDSRTPGHLKRHYQQRQDALTTGSAPTGRLE